MDLSFTTRRLKLIRCIHPVYVLVISLLLLSACGGGSSPATPDPPAVVDTELDWNQGNWDQENWQ